MMIKARRINGKIKWKIKNLFNVGLWIEYPPESHSTNDGNADNKLVITVAPHKDICPKGNTYPKNAMIHKNKSKRIPENHVFGL